MRKSPLRYPGGKSRAVPQIMKRLGRDFEEFREPFVGGGSVFIHVRQVKPGAKVWINDINFDLFCFWKEVQKDASKLAYKVDELRNQFRTGRELFDDAKTRIQGSLSDFDRAALFFVLNRITFSGTILSGGYSEQAYRSRFTPSSIARLQETGDVMRDVRITNFDYKDVVREKGEDVTLFLDPPYLTAEKSKLYGKNGDLHVGFPHDEFSRVMEGCGHKWLATYDDTAEIERLFGFARIEKWSLQYGMNNSKGHALRGAELFIYN